MSGGADRAPIDDVLAGAVGRGEVPGAVAIVADRERTLYEGAFGHSDLQRQRPMTMRTLFRLASMTKLVTAVAVMQLVDEGRLDLDVEVEHVLPEFGELPVLSGFDGDVPLLRAPSRGATVRELVAHTSGLSYDVWNADVFRYAELTGTPGIASGLRATLRTPLVADPGTIVEYGTGLDWAGLVVEAIAGEPLDRRFARSIFGPLGMGETSVTLEGDRAERCAPVLGRAPGGSFAATSFDYPQAPEFCTGGGCLYSTAADYCRLQLALLGGGALDGRRILSEQAVDEMFRVQTGELRMGVLRTMVPPLSTDAAVGAGLRWGMGMCVADADVPGGRSAGSGSWCGIFNTYFWIDRGRGLVAGLYMQYTPFYDDVAAALLGSFERAVYGALRPGAV